MSNFSKHIVRVDREALVRAAETIRAHSELLRDAAVDLGLDSLTIFNAQAALGHVLHDDFRSSETRGGS